MKSRKLILLVVLSFLRRRGWPRMVRAWLSRSAEAPDIAAAIDQEIRTIEKQVVEAAEAMPEDKFNFTPAGLQLPGSDYKGVRTFALQVKHVAASNYSLVALTGDKIQDYWAERPRR